MGLFGIPTVGKNALGETVTGITTPNQLITANDANRIGKSNPPVWSNVRVNSLTKVNGEVVGFGSGINQSGISEKLIWKNDSNGWVIGHGFPEVNFSSITPITYINSNYYIATGGNVSLVSMNKIRPLPAGGFSTQVEDRTDIVSDDFPDNADSFSSTTSDVVAYTREVVGTRNYPDWSRQTGEVELIPTTQLSTSYTFPGYSGTNSTIQRVVATPVKNGTPINWTFEPVDGTLNSYPDTIPVSSIIVGGYYRINDLGDTDWTIVGATSTVGAKFIATAIGTGTGTVDPLFTGFYGLNHPSLSVKWTLS
jgi:hypothetical protein